jgi:uncharacterized membrane protein YphA (DoxX/SURF4 family)
MDAATVVVTGLLAALFLSTGAMKLAGVAQSLEMRDQLGLPARTWVLIGALEVAGAGGALLGLAVRELGVAATGGLVLLSVGAIATHVRAGDPPAKAVPAAFALLLAAGALALQAATA